MRSRPHVKARRTALYLARRLMLGELAHQDPRCKARIPGVCLGLARDGHELLRRSAGGRIDDPANVRLLCRPCHNYVGAHPLDAIRLGLAISRATHVRRSRLNVRA